MKKMNCVLLRTHDVEDDIGFALIRRVVRCIGLRQNTHGIKQQKGGWKRVWYGNYTNLKMPRIHATPVIMIKNDGMDIYVNAQAITHGLVYFATYSTYIGVLNKHGDRKDIPFEYFSMKHKEVTFLNEGTADKWIGYENNTCDEIVRIETCNGTECPLDINRQPHIVALWGQAGMPCHRKPTILSEMYYHHEQVIIDDQTTTWWKALLSAFINTIKNIAVAMIKSLISLDWESTILKCLLIYYISTWFLKNNWLALAMTTAWAFSGFI